MLLQTAAVAPEVAVAAPFLPVALSTFPPLVVVVTWTRCSTLDMTRSIPASSSATTEVQVVAARAQGVYGAMAALALVAVAVTAEQRTADWFTLRAFRVTASVASLLRYRNRRHARTAADVVSYAAHFNVYCA